MLNRNLFNLSSRTPTTLRDVNDWSDLPTTSYISTKPSSSSNKPIFSSTHKTIPKIIPRITHEPRSIIPSSNFAIQVQYVNNTETYNNSFFNRQLDTISFNKSTSNLPTYFGVSNTRKSTIENMLINSADPINSSRPQIGYSRTAIDTHDPSTVFTKDYSSYISNDHH